MKNTLNIGIVGAGAVVKDLHLPVIANLNDVKIQWICDINKKSASMLAKNYHIKKVYSDIDECHTVDIVLIAIPVGFRKNVMEKVIKNQWDVFCEKPFAVTKKEFRKYIQLAKDYNIQIGVGMVRRYGPATITAKDIIGNNIFGEIEQIYAYEGLKTKRTGRENNWYLGDPKISGGGVLMETGTHLIDQLCTILGAKEHILKECYQKIYKGLEYETVFVGTLMNKYQNKINCKIKVSRLEDLNNGIFIKFKNFILKCGLFFQEPLELLDLKEKKIAHLNKNLGANTIGQGFYLEWRDFIEQCRKREPSYIDAITAIQSASIIEECYDKAEMVNIENL